MIHFFDLFFWGIAVLFSWLGYGWLISTLLTRSHNRQPAWFFGIGLAATIFFGGVLNFYKIISPFTIECYVAIGCILGVVYAFRSLFPLTRFFLDLFNFRENGVAKVIKLCLIVLIILRYAGALATPIFNDNDDYQGYFVFPEKMIQTGSLGNDPFSERRIVSSVGGQAFLDAIVLSRGSFQNLNFPDAGIAFIAFIIVMAGLLRHLGVDEERFLLLMFLLVLIQVPAANICALYSALCLFGMLVWLVYSVRESTAGIGILLEISLIVAGICALKNSYAPAAVVLVISYYWLRYGFPLRSKTAMRHLLLLALTVTIFLFPWFASSYISSGTPYYPLLGKGFHGSVYGTYLTATSELSLQNLKDFFWEIENPLFAVLGIILFLLVTRKTAREELTKEDIYLGTGLIVSFVIISYATAGYAVYRYSFAYLLPATVVFLGRMKNKIALILISLLLGSAMSSFFGYKGAIKRALSFGLSGEGIVSNETKKSYLDLQRSVPVGEKILARLDRNFLFDFNRNEVYIIDYPGGSSLPPGMPFFAGPQKLVEYLRSVNIRYVAYSYANEANFHAADMVDRLKPDANAWIRTEAMHTLDFQDSIQKLVGVSTVVYNDGHNLVLKLY